MAEVDYKLLFDIIENDFCYKKTDLGILVTVSTADGKEDVSINSDKFISIITSRYRKQCGMVISTAPIKNCIRSFQGDIVINRKRSKIQTAIYTEIMKYGLIRRIGQMPALSSKIMDYHPFLWG